MEVIREFVKRWICCLNPYAVAPLVKTVKKRNNGHTDGAISRSCINCVASADWIGIIRPTLSLVSISWETRRIRRHRSATRYADTISTSKLVGGDRQLTMVHPRKIIAFVDSINDVHVWSVGRYGALLV